MIRCLILFLGEPGKKTSLNTIKHVIEYVLSLEVLKMSTTGIVNIMAFYNTSLIVEILLRNKTKMKNCKYYCSNHLTLGSWKYFVTMKIKKKQNIVESGKIERSLLMGMTFQWEEPVLYWTDSFIPLKFVVFRF